jgi:hydroxyacylglutathione hydrolase
MDNNRYGMKMNIVQHENGPFLVNTYLVINEKTGDGFILDPGSDLKSLLEGIRRDGIKISAIVCTHGHIDHIAGAKMVQDAFSVPLFINRLEEDMVKGVSDWAGMFGVPDPGAPNIDEYLPDSGVITLAGMPFNLLHTPGHSPGSVSLYAEDVVFSGDVLFNMSIGRTDLPGGDYQTLITAVQERLFTLPGETRVLCGHGPVTTIADEKMMNPFF